MVAARLASVSAAVTQQHAAVSASTLWALSLSVLAGALGQLMLKAGSSRRASVEPNVGTAAMLLYTLRDGGTLLGLLLYIIAVVLWIAVLSRMEVSLAYPLAAVGYAINALAARLWLGERVSMRRLAGIGIIILGVAIVASS